MRAPGESHRLRHALQVVVHDHDVGGFHCRIGARRPHGKADVRLRQRRCVVDAVARHAGGAVLLLHFPDDLQLGFRQQVAACIGDTCLCRDGLRCGGVIAGEHHRRHAQRPQVDDGLSGCFLDRICHGEDGQHLLVVREQGQCAALLFVFGEFRLKRGAAQARLMHGPVVAQHQTLAVDAAFDASSRKRLEILHLGRIGQLGRDCLGHRMVGACCQAGGGVLDRRFIRTAPCLPLHQLGLAFGDGSGLVQGDGLEQPRVFKVDAALDQNPATGCRGQAADHRDGCRDDQSAGTGYDQQHQGFVDGFQPCQVQQERRSNRYQDGNRKNRRCIDGGKLVHKSLCRRALALRLLHGFDDAGQRGIACYGRHAQFEFTGLVDRAGKHGVSGRFVHGNAFSGDRRLVYGAIALGDNAVQGYAFTGLDADGRANGDGVGRRGNPGAFGGELQRLFWRQVEQS